MAFTSIIAHHVHRDSPESRVTSQLRAEGFAAQGSLLESAQELKTHFIRKGGKQYGRFATDTALFPAPAWLQEYRQGRLGFVSLTHKWVTQLALEIEKTSSTLDGYLFFVEESLEAGQSLSLFFAEHQHAVYLDGTLELDHSRYLDTAGFTLAARVNLDDWEAGNSATYLTLLTARGDRDLAAAFADAIGFSDKYDIKADTSRFLEVVDTYSKNLDEQAARLTRNKVVDYCLEQSKAGQPVVLNELSQTLASETGQGAPDDFVRFVESRQEEPPAEFIPDSGQIRNYVRLSGRNDSLSMSFASECLGKEIEYDAEKDVLMIKNIPTSLKSKLLKHLKRDSN